MYFQRKTVDVLKDNKKMSAQFKQLGGTPITPDMAVVRSFIDI